MKKLHCGIRVLGAVFILALVVCAFSTSAFALDADGLSDATRPFPENGWIYYPSGDTSQYNNLDSISNLEYDSEGRVIRFTGKYSSGSSSVTELSYQGNKVYDQYGNFLGYAYSSNTSPGVQASSKESIKTQTRMITRLVRNRIAMIQAPKPQNVMNEQQMAMKNRLQSQVAMEIAGAEADQVAYELDKEKTEGIAAGEAVSEQLGLGIWLSGGYSMFGNTADTTDYDGYSGLTMLGVDYRLTDRTVVGLGFGMEGSYIDSNFYGLDGESGSIGWTFAPYLSIALFDQTIFDLIGGVSLLSNGSTESGFWDSVRVMVSPNVTQYFVLENWLLSGSLGFTYARETGYNYSSSSNAPFVSLPEHKFAIANTKPDPLETGELRVAGRGAYAFQYLMPFLEVAYINDIMEKEEDPDEMEVTMGVDVYPTDSFILSAEAAYSFFREDTYNARFMMNLRYEF